MSNPTVNECLTEIASEVKKAEEELSDLILRVPTGPRRNALCNANIHLIAAIDEFKKAWLI